MLRGVTSQMPRYISEVTIGGKTEELCKTGHQDKLNVITVRNWIPTNVLLKVG